MSLRPPSLPYDRAQIVRWFGADTIARAAPYVTSVSRLQWDGHTLRGCVRGTEPWPSEVAVDIYRDGHHIHVSVDCSCSARHTCVHAVALLLAGLELDFSTAAPVRAELLGWLEAFRQRVGTPEPKASAPKKPTHALIYVLEWSRYHRRHEVEFFKATVDKDGSIRSIGEPWDNVDRALLNPPKFVREDDLALLRLLWLARSRDGYGGYGLSGGNGALAMECMLATGRCFARDAEGDVAGTPLRLGRPRPGTIQWEPRSDEQFQPALRTDPPCAMVIVTDPVWYVDPFAGQAGVAEFPWPAKRLADYLSMPPISAAEAALVAAVVREVAPELPPPPTEGATAIRVLDIEPRAVLRLNTLPVLTGHFGGRGRAEGELHHATAHFDYEEFTFEAGNHTTLVRASNGDMVQVRRRVESERSRLAELQKAGLTPIPSGRFYGPQGLPSALLGLADPDAWEAFVHDTLPALRASGWRIEMGPEFRFNVITIDAIDGQLKQADDGWFDVEMGIVVGDRTVRLVPLLAELFRRDRRWLGGALESIAESEAVDLSTELGERLRIRAERLKPVVRVLIDLFDGMDGGPLRISQFDTGRLDLLTDTGRWQFHGDDSVRRLAQRLRDGKGVVETTLPKRLRATLRSYQHQGLSWMQYLREHGLSGVLADDMGLGKTIQTLAHLLVEKEAGRLDRPALVVVPTSLVHNWCEEARRFAPSLRVLPLHGSSRKDRFDRIPEHDLVLTTYALLWRDEEALSKHAYHVLILDEAQFVKNASTKAAVAIREFDARHRLCLTGTPLENHLGELWSLFDFLLPGFLGTHKDFSKRWRTPIEKSGDTVRRDLLARRIRPFMLRRRKDEVARELPAKTTIVSNVELDGAQRDLYETVRAAMQEKVREAIAAQGLNRSHIIVLEALLKLRQVCCDPRLVRLKQAGHVKESAKLDLLLSMLPDLIEEGRRVLLFSQFTGMLALIAAAVDERGIPYVMLTGDTRDRATPVKRFQAGEVPLFLISLKAGGVGLNLTAADTVIHYDPWWNPAVENQATDRAHRLGQDKPVFVYKLIVAGSIEEKIVQLQEKKAALAAGILSEDGAAVAKFSEDDLNALFAPMPPAE